MTVPILRDRADKIIVKDSLRLYTSESKGDIGMKKRILGITLIVADILSCSSRRDAPDTDSKTRTDTDTAADADSETETESETNTFIETDSDDFIIHLKGVVGAAAWAYVSNADEFGHSIYWTKEAEIGPCTFYSASFGECIPECTAPEECGADNQCHDESWTWGFINAGTITVSGLKSELSLVPISVGANDYYTSYWTTEPTTGAIFDEGDTITATSPGGELGAFEVSVTGCAEMTADLTCPPSIVNGESLTIRWTPGDAAKDTVRFAMQSGNHASQFSSIICETDDTGSLVVDASLISAYLADSLSIDLWEIHRFRDGVADAEGGRVVLRATSSAGCRW